MIEIGGITMFTKIPISDNECKIIDDKSTEICKELAERWKQIDDIHEKIVTLTSCICSIADYCKSQQGCNQCLIKPWCKSLKNKCPEEWRNNICQEIDTQVVDQDKKN